MDERYIPPVKIEPKEAVVLWDYCTLYCIERSRELYDEFIKEIPQDSDNRWYFYSLIAFVYMAARIQGIREERERKNRYKNRNKARKSKKPT